ncbi:helix-turn-helix domain-containing protein [Lentzea albidocapillata]|uniref:Helix-turn-helix domain-containing protein n=1 Tax=Lentzea albidocapillata TaxID=40571 RepID=A0A1W2BGQ8_9PSEU|nr:helix-turn-helix transcriptional regulator [Lentzea albidocapillata]SMC72036.1 Helix-turn-helix domain-containing protein [Lentzea albidocapillata]
MPKRDSTAQGREFGKSLRDAIRRTGFTSRELADKSGWDESKLSNVINGKGGATEVELAVLFGFCGFDPDEREHLFLLAQTVNSKSWLQNHDGRPIRRRTFEENLVLAKELICWQAHEVPDLLQTPAYMRAVIEASLDESSEDLEQRVAARLELQKELRQRRNLTCAFYIHESALRLPVGGRDVLVEQLHELLRLSVRDSINIQIVPAAVGAHAGMKGPFLQLNFHAFRSLVCVEQENSTLFLEDKVQVDGYSNIVRPLSKCSLDEEASRALIAHLGEALTAEEGVGCFGPRLLPCEGQAPGGIR